MADNELKQKANEFYAREIFMSEGKKRVYIDCKDKLFTLNEGHLFIGEYTSQISGRDFFMDVITRLGEYTKDYKVNTSLQNIVMEEE